MKIMLIALNSQYIHSNPALFCLERVERAASCMVKTYQWSINMSELTIMAEIEREKPDILAFSLYIWNIVFAAGLLRDLRLLLPDTLIVAGGPEPSGHPQQILAQIPELDALFLGEGEESWPLFLRAVTDLDDSTAGCGSLRQRFMGDGAAYAPIPGLLLRSGGKIAAAPQVDLARQPFLYSPEDLARLAREKRVIYYESSRGCPYCCSFCASATESLRERPLELVLEELPLLAATGGQVKFIDRTFNARPQRAIAITEKILSLYRPGLSWHFELAPAACSGALADLLGQSPPGYFHLEAGVQTLYPPSLKAVGRNVDWPQAEPVLQKFAAGPCRLHVDLIAGLPYETPQSFSLAFQALHRLNADYLQLGFLKILPGSLLAQEAAAYGLVYSPRPPYQILYTPEMSSGYLFGLHRAERALNAFYNKGPYRSLLMEKGETWPGGALAMYFALAEGLKKYPSGLSEKTAAVIINECFGNS